MLRIGHGDDPQAAPLPPARRRHGTGHFHVGKIRILILEEIVDASNWHHNPPVLPHLRTTCHGQMWKSPTFPFEGPLSRCLLTLDLCRCSSLITRELGLRLQVLIEVNRCPEPDCLWSWSWVELSSITTFAYGFILFMLFHFHDTLNISFHLAPFCAFSRTRVWFQSHVLFFAIDLQDTVASAAPVLPNDYRS